jgi:hypothetical protein
MKFHEWEIPAGVSIQFLRSVPADRILESDTRRNDISAHTSKRNYLPRGIQIQT